MPSFAATQRTVRSGAKKLSSSPESTRHLNAINNFSELLLANRSIHVSHINDYAAAIGYIHSNINPKILCNHNTANDTDTAPYDEFGGYRFASWVIGFEELPDNDGFDRKPITPRTLRSWCNEKRMFHVSRRTPLIINSGHVDFRAATRSSRGLVYQGTPERKSDLLNALALSFALCANEETNNTEYNNIRPCALPVPSGILLCNFEARQEDTSNILYAQRRHLDRKEPSERSKFPESSSILHFTNGIRANTFFSRGQLNENNDKMQALKRILKDFDLLINKTEQGVVINGEPSTDVLYSVLNLYSFGPFDNTAILPNILKKWRSEWEYLRNEVCAITNTPHWQFAMKRDRGTKARPIIPPSP